MLTGAGSWATATRQYLRAVVSLIPMDFAILLYVQPLARNLLARAVLDSVTQNRKMMGKVRRTRRAMKVKEMVAIV